MNRRDYAGTTPFSPEDVKIAQNGSDSERAAFLHEQGVDLALFVDSLIQKCSIPQQGIALVAWSLGNVFMLSLLASITTLPVETQRRLKAYVKMAILWGTFHALPFSCFHLILHLSEDPPSQALGIESPADSYVPLYDEDLAPEARGPAFGTWAASYWIHGDLSNHDPAQFNYRNPDPSKKATTDAMTPEELFSLADFVPGGRTETILTEPPFAAVLNAQTQKALFSTDIREAWSETKFLHLLGTANTWNIHLSQWALQDKTKADALQIPPLISFEVYEGANHFVRVFC